MTYNPYEPPTAGAPAAAHDFDELMRRDLRIIGQMQKVILLCIATNLALIVTVLIVAGTPLLSMVRFVAYGVTLFQLWAVARLSWKLYGGGIAVFATLGMFVPCFSLVVLLILSQAATKRLRDAGIQVGLFGAKLSELP